MADSSDSAGQQLTTMVDRVTTDGNQSETARLLHMPRRTLVHELESFGIKRGAYEAD